MINSILIHFFEWIKKKLEKVLTKLIGEKKSNDIIHNKNERVDDNAESTDIKKILREYYELHYANKFDNSDQMKYSLKDMMYQISFKK